MLFDPYGFGACRRFGHELLSLLERLRSVLTKYSRPRLIRLKSLKNFSLIPSFESPIFIYDGIKRTVI